MDISSLIATVQDPVLRNEMIMSLGEEQLAQLPPNLRAEATQAREAAAEQRRRQQREVQMMMEQRERFGAHPPNPFGGAHRFGMGRNPFDFAARDGLFGDGFDNIYQRGMGGERMCSNCGRFGHLARDCLEARRQNDQNRVLAPAQVIF